VGTRAATRTVHVIVCLADNEHQGIIPVPAKLGNGDDAADNLYWGALYGVKTHFSRSKDWSPVLIQALPETAILERCVFKHKSGDVYMVADAYRGGLIKQAIADFLRAVSGGEAESISLGTGPQALSLNIASGADLMVYIGHNGLMDFGLDETFPGHDARCREAMILACYSRSYFSEPLRRANARSLLWTTGLMAPEAYILSGALDGWVLGEAPQQIAARAAEAYARYQKIDPAAAKKLLVTGLELVRQER
jgi:hypothetical protein